MTKLNPAQQEAIDTIEGPVLVVAGPGSGKTQVLAMRIANILKKTDAQPRNILCLTYTEAGVLAMRKRLHSIIGEQAYYVGIYTFHGFCNEVIRSHPEKFALFQNNPKQLDDVERIKLNKTLLDNLDPGKKWQIKPLGDPYQNHRQIAGAIQELKREGIAPEELSDYATSRLAELEESPKLNKKTGEPTIEHTRNVKAASKLLELALLYTEYQKALIEKNFYDYEDMVLWVNNALETDDELLAEYQEQYLYILVDEFQDTNGAQGRLVTQLASFDESPNIFAVGDDDQAIYRFQGANVDNLLYFAQQFSNTRVIPLTINYRSSRHILELAQNSITHNKIRLATMLEGMDKTLTPATDSKGSKPEVGIFTNDQKEAEFIVKKVKSMLSEGVEADEIAIIYRKHSDADDIAEALMKFGVPVRLVAGDNALDNLAVRQLLNLLKLIGGVFDPAGRLTTEVLMYDFIQEKFGIENTDVMQLIVDLNKERFFAHKVPTQKSLPELLWQPDSNLSQNIKDFGQQLLIWRKAASNSPVSTFVATLLEESGILKPLFSEEPDIDTINGINAFYSFIKARAQIEPEASISQIIEDLELISENQIKIPERDIDTGKAGVRLMTAHSAKGLEFDHVFMIKLYNGNWGNKRSRDIFKLPQLGPNRELFDRESGHEEEDERRLFFVGATRAKKSLTLTTALEYHTGLSSKEVEPSIYLSELAPDLVTKIDVDEAEGSDLEYLKTMLSTKPVVKIDDREVKLLAKLLEDFRLSASAMNEYIECPLKFKFNRLLKFPIPPNNFVSLGNAAHYALEHWALADLGGEEFGIKELLHKFENRLQTELLPADAYRQVLIEGKEILTAYYNFYRGSLGEIAGVEYNFGRHSVVLNLPSQEPVILSGKVDKIEWLDKDSSSVKITDYKTTSPKSENEIRGLTKSGSKNIWRQLVFYKLLAELDDQFRPASSKPKYNVESVEVDFLKSENNKFKKLSFTISSEDVEELKREIADVITSIRSLNFNGTEEYPLCGECEYCNEANLPRHP